MTTYTKTISGTATVPADVANGAQMTLPSYPRGTNRAAWAGVDPATLQVAYGGQNVLKGSQVSLALGANMVITNNSGFTWVAGTRLSISARQPSIDVMAVSQTNYDALPAKDANTLYVIPS